MQQNLCFLKVSFELVFVATFRAHKDTDSLILPGGEKFPTQRPRIVPAYHFQATRPPLARKFADAVRARIVIVEPGAMRSPGSNLEGNIS